MVMVESHELHQSAETVVSKPLTHSASSTLEWINTVNRLIWLAVSPRQSRMSTIARKGLSLFLPPAQKGFSQFGYHILGRRTAYDYLRAQYHLASLAPYLPRTIHDNSERLLAIEIGPGTGLLALVKKQFFPNRTLVLVDLPDVLSFSSFFLTTLMPGGRFLFLDKFRLEHDRWMEYHFAMIPPEATRQLPTKSFHLAMNTDSMQEMELATIRESFLLLMPAAPPPALLYSSNRVQRWTGNTNTRLADYPYQEADRELFSRENASMHRRWIWRKNCCRIPYRWCEPRRNGQIVMQKLTVLTTNRRLT